MSAMAEPGTRETTVCYRHPRVETAVSCSECGRPICTDCMSFGPVGIRCPECSGQPVGAKKAVQQIRAAPTRLPADVVTISLIVINVAVFVAELATGSGVSSLGGTLVLRGGLVGILVADGDWYRLITSAFLHANLIHLLFNMLFLWWFGRSLERVIGPGRFVGIYLVAALAGAAGALISAPANAITVGASGAVFGILGAGFILERNHIAVFGGQALFVIVINLVLSLVLSGISIGGHIGGVIGGALAMLALNHFGRYKPLGSREGLAAIASLVGLAALSVLVAYLKVRGYA
jgi:membrane associated rhomboid family serine protease